MFGDKRFIPAKFKKLTLHLIRCDFIHNNLEYLKN